MEFLALLPEFDLVAMAGAYGPWAALGALTVCKAAAIWCNNTKSKDTKMYKLLEWLADNHKEAKK